MLNNQILESLIIEKLPGIYNPVGMDEVLVSIEQASPKIRESIEKYLTEGVQPMDEIDVTSYEYLHGTRGMNPIAALLTIDLLLKHPERKNEFLKD